MKLPGCPNAGMVVMLGYSDKVDLAEALAETDPFYYYVDWDYDEYSGKEFHAVFTKWLYWSTWHPWSANGDYSDYSLFDNMALLQEDYALANKLVRKGFSRDEAAMKIMQDDEARWSRIEKQERRAEW